MKNHFFPKKNINNLTKDEWFKGKISKIYFTPPTSIRVKKIIT